MSNSVLSIIKGVGRTPGDTGSAEADRVELNLLDPQGFSQVEFDMQFPALKSGAVWADSPVVDGRTLMSAALGNVTETIRLTLTAGSISGLAFMMSTLNQMARDCEAFWESFHQIEPVYLKHQVAGEPGPRYALLYNIDLAVDEPAAPGDPSRDVTLTLEREYGWRGVRPGGNPQEWTAYRRGVPFNVDYVDLLDGNNHLFQATIQNRHEWNSTTYQSSLSKNYVDIPAADVSGDLPALLELSTSLDNIKDLFVAIDTPPFSITDRAAPPVEHHKSVILNAGDGIFSGSGSMVSHVDGVFSNGSNVTEYIGQTAATSDTLSWGNAISLGNRSYLAQRIYAGQYMVFLRHRQTTGVYGDVTLDLSLKEIGLAGGGGPSTSISLPTQKAMLRAGTNGSQWEMLYMGMATIPFANRTAQAPGGYGIAAPEFFDLWIDLLITNASARTVQVCDLMLIPIQHQAIRASNYDPTILFQCIIDNTGYMTHGQPGLVARIGDSDNISIAMQDVAGQELTLPPKQDSRLCIFFSQVVAGATNYSNPARELTIRANIVPRWSGLRDV